MQINESLNEHQNRIKGIEISFKYAANKKKVYSILSAKRKIVSARLTSIEPFLSYTDKAFYQRCRMAGL